MAIASARLMPAFIMLPFFNTGTLSNAIRIPVAMIIAAALWPYTQQQMTALDKSLQLLILAKESAIGLVIACFLCLPCWVLHAAGSIIDNQRGATLSSSLDPVSGIDSSELANFFNMFATVVILQSGGLLLLLEVFEKSYLLWRPFEMSFPAIHQILGFLTLLMTKSIILASPLLVTFLLCELFLGLLARYSPQLNAFSMALTVKSSVGFLLLLIYFNPIFPEKAIALRLLPETLTKWGVTLF